jgi:tripartite-type tricarboxylate transporter receptor subunit TctC
MNQQNISRRAFSIGLCATAATASSNLFAQDNYPSRPIKFLNPNPAGAGSDSVLRAYAQEVAKILNGTTFVENRGGAGSTIGSEAGAKSAPDGYTVTMTSGALFSIVPLIYPKLNFDPVKDFKSVVVMSSFENVLVVNKTLPVSSVKELVEYARKNPGAVIYGSSGNGTTTHMCGEMFKQMAKLDIRHVPYRGSAPATQDLIGGQINMMFNSVAAVLPHVKSGALKALAVTGSAKSQFLPEVPTMAGAGIPGYNASGWISLSLPRDTPDAIVERLSKASVEALKSPVVIRAMHENGFELVGKTGKDMDAMVQEEINRWTPIVKTSGARIE